MCLPPQTGVMVAWVHFASYIQRSSQLGRGTHTHVIHLSPSSCLIYDFPFHFQDCPIAYSPQILTLGTATNSFPFQPHQPGWSQLPGAPLLPSHLALAPSSTLEPKQTKGLWKWADIQEAAGTIYPPPHSIPSQKPLWGLKYQDTLPHLLNN